MFTTQKGGKRPHRAVRMGQTERLLSHGGHVLHKRVIGACLPSSLVYTCLSTFSTLLCCISSHSLKFLKWNTAVQSRVTFNANSQSFEVACPTKISSEMGQKVPQSIAILGITDCVVSLLCIWMNPPIPFTNVFFNQRCKWTCRFFLVLILPDSSGFS